MGPADFAWLDAQRTAHFPADRNVLPAHLTLFHHVPPSACAELLRLFKAEVCGMAPVARITGLISLGRGVAYRVASDGLEAIRDRIAAALKGQLTPQDNAPWRPHVTIQNKVPLRDARALREALAAEFRPRPLAITGLAAFYYRDGPWEPIADYRFNRSVRSPRN